LYIIIYIYNNLDANHSQKFRNFINNVTDVIESRIDKFLLFIQ